MLFFCVHFSDHHLCALTHVNIIAIKGLMADCPNLAELGLLDCMSIDESILGSVRLLKYSFVARTENIKWKLMVEIERMLKTVLL
ncbi:hypothetical protein SUGI_0899030 [Cryptomeria japonica]|nr:hypothetical protein SUGI_0899030 [Cryptomeria japonica]